MPRIFHLSDGVSRESSGELVLLRGRIEIICGDYAETLRRRHGLVNEDNGARGPVGIGDLRAGVGRNCCLRWNSAGWERGQTINTHGNVDVPGIDSEGNVSEGGRNSAGSLTGRKKIQVDRSGTRRLMDEAKGDLPGGSGAILIDQGELLGVGDGVAEQDGVLGGGCERGLGGGERLPTAGGVGVDGIEARRERDVRGNGSEIEVECEGVRILIEVEAGSVRRGMDDANLRLGSGAYDGLTAGEGCKDYRRSNQTEREMGELERLRRHGEADSRGLSN